MKQKREAYEVWVMKALWKLQGLWNSCRISQTLGNRCAISTAPTGPSADLHLCSGFQKAKVPSFHGESRIEV